MCWPYIVKVIHQPLPNIFINAFSHKLSGIFKEPCATQSVCFCHHLCWAPAHLPLHYWATSSDHLFSMRFRFSVNLQRWERKVLRLFGHSCSKPLGTSQLSQYNRYKAVSRRDEKTEEVGGWVGWGVWTRPWKTLGHLVPCGDAEMPQIRSPTNFTAAARQLLCVFTALYHLPWYPPWWTSQLPDKNSTYLLPFLPVQGDLNLKSRCGWACWSITRCRRTQKVIFSKN